MEAEVDATWNQGPGTHAAHGARLHPELDQPHKHPAFSQWSHIDGCKSPKTPVQR